MIGREGRGGALCLPLIISFLIFFVMHALRIDPGGNGEKHGEAWRRSGTAGRRGGRRRRRRRGATTMIMHNDI